MVKNFELKIQGPNGEYSKPVISEKTTVFVDSSNLGAISDQHGNHFEAPGTILFPIPRVGSPTRRPQYIVPLKIIVTQSKSNELVVDGDQIISLQRPPDIRFEYSGDVPNKKGERTRHASVTNFPLISTNKGMEVYVQEGNEMRRGRLIFTEH